MYPKAVKTVLKQIFYQHAKILSKASALKKTKYGIDYESPRKPLFLRNTLFFVSS